MSRYGRPKSDDIATWKSWTMTALVFSFSSFSWLVCLTTGGRGSGEISTIVSIQYNQNHRTILRNPTILRTRDASVSQKWVRFGSVFMQITSVSVSVSVITELMSVSNGSVNRIETWSGASKADFYGSGPVINMVIIELKRH